MAGVFFALGFIVASFVATIAAPAAFAVPLAATTDEFFDESMAPGDGLGLAPSPSSDPGRSPGRSPFVPIGGAGLGSALLAGSVLVRRRGGGSRRDPGPLFVYVPGHGGDPDGF